MPNTFEYADWLSMELLRLLVNKLEVSDYFNSDYNKEFTQEFPIGESVRVPYPQRFTIRNGLGYTPQPINRIHATITIDQIFGVDFEWDDAEAALKLSRGRDKIKREYLEPAAAQIAQEWDSRCALYAYQHTNNIVGVLGADPTSFSSISGAARQRMYEMAGWGTGKKRGLCIPPSVVTALTNASVSYFNPTDAISQQFKEGSIGRQAGFDWHESMSLYSHTAGTWQGAVTVNTTSVTGDSTIVVNCTSGDTFKAGDKIGVASVYKTNPMTRRRTTSATTFTFTVLADVTATASTATLSISPTIYGPGSQYQNVTRVPTANDVLTLFPGTASPNGKTGTIGLAMNPDAFALVGVKLQVPQAVELASQSRDPDTGIAVRFVRAWDPIQSKMTNRFDTCGGFGSFFPDSCSIGILCA